MVIDNILEQIINDLILLWDTIILIGNFVSLATIVIGVIYWLTDYDPRGGKKIVVGGILLFIIIMYLSQNPPMLITSR